MPIGPKRALRRTAAMTAETTPPPEPRTEATANWADPENATIEKTTGASVPQPRERASTPKEIPSTSVARANGTDARAPARYEDRKSTRLNSSHANISYAVFCLKKKH